VRIWRCPCILSSFSVFCRPINPQQAPPDDRFACARDVGIIGHGAEVSELVGAFDGGRNSPQVRKMAHSPEPKRLRSCCSAGIIIGLSLVPSRSVLQMLAVQCRVETSARCPKPRGPLALVPIGTLMPGRELLDIRPGRQRWEAGRWRAPQPSASSRRPNLPAGFGESQQRRPLQLVLVDPPHHGEELEGKRQHGAPWRR